MAAFKASRTTKLATKVFAEGANLLDNLLRAGSEDTAELVSNSCHEHSWYTSRIDEEKEVPKARFITPSMALKQATKRADVVIIPNLLPDVIREEKEKEILSKADWSAHLAKLGFKGEFLQVALERKKRSTLQADARKKEREAEKAEAARLALEKALVRDKVKVRVRAVKRVRKRNLVIKIPKIGSRRRRRRRRRNWCQKMMEGRKVGIEHRIRHHRRKRTFK